LGDLLNVKHGFAFLGQYFGEAGTHVVLTPGNFYERGGFKSKGEKEKWYSGPVPPEYVLRRGDVVVAMTEQAEGLLGASATVPDDGLYLHNQRLGLVQVRDGEADGGFIYYLFNLASVRQQIRATATGVKVRHTAPSRIATVRVVVPGVKDQRQIAAILSAYDDLIENCERRIRVLDEMARALYNEWFVHLRYPGHEQTPMVESPLGPVPKGWPLDRLGAVVCVHRGRSYRSTDLGDDGGVPFVTLKCIDREGGFRRDGVKRFVGTAPESHPVRRGDIVVAVTDMTQERRVVARAALVPALGAESGVLSMDVVRLEPLGSHPTAWIFGYLRYSDFADHLKQHANGANVLHLSPDRIRDHRLAMPPPMLAQAFAARVGPVFELQDVLGSRVEALRMSRDLLLPRLLSGQLKLEDAA
jgi:type I restriction enzyme S subunit